MEKAAVCDRRFFLLHLLSQPLAFNVSAMSALGRRRTLCAPCVQRDTRSDDHPIVMPLAILPIKPSACNAITTLATSMQTSITATNQNAFRCVLRSNVHPRLLIFPVLQALRRETPLTRAKEPQNATVRAWSMIGAVLNSEDEMPLLPQPPYRSSIFPRHWGPKIL